MTAATHNERRDGHDRHSFQNRPSLTATLLTLLTLLLVVTVGAIVVVGRLMQQRSIEDLQARTLAAATLAVGFAITADTEPAAPLLEQARAMALKGWLPLDDPTALGLYLVEWVRHQPDIDWLSYSDQASGRFVGAWRRADGAIVLNSSDPARDGGRPTEFEVTNDGQRIPFQRNLRGGHDPRGQFWYQQAVASDSLIWTEPFEVTDGPAAVTAALAVRQPVSGELRGVFSVDFDLSELSRYLDAVSRGRTRVRHPLYAVVSRNGKTVAHNSASEGQETEILARAILALPAEPRALPLDRPIELTFRFADVSYDGQARVMTIASGLEWLIIAAVPDDEMLEIVHQNQQVALSIGLAVLLAAILVGALLSRRIAQPLRLIAADLVRVGRFELSPEPSPRSFVRELVVVSDAVDRMKVSLRSFGRYVPTQLVQDVLASGQEARLGGRSCVLTLFFSDIEGFTRISESMPPDELVDHLGEYLAAMTTIIQEQQGTVDKFIGDGILALFGAPKELPDHQAEACRAALRCQARLAELASDWEQRGQPILRTRIGLHSGEVIVGNIGTPERFEFTVIGDPVNLASRLEGLNKVYGTWIMASQELREAAGPDFEWRTLDRVAVVGRTGGTLVSELLGERGSVAPAILEARDLYETALEAYFAGEFARAAAGFRAASQVHPAGHAAAVMADRAEELAQAPTPADWDGVYRATAK